MSIKSKLILGGALFVVAIALISSGLFFINRRQFDAEQKRILANNLAFAILERNIFLDDYLSNKTKRAEQQLIAQNNSVGNYLTEAFILFTEKDSLSELMRIEANNTFITASIESLIENPNDTTEYSLQSEDRSILEIYTKSQSNAGYARGLAKKYRAQVINLRNLINVLSVVFIFIALALSLGAIVVVINVVRSIARLHEGTDRIAKGDLNHRVSINTHDEIGQLAQSFNLMTERLQESYENLEQKIQDRTKDLAQAKAKDEAMLTSIGDSLIAVDTNGKVMFVNKIFEKMLGLKLSEVQGKTLFQIGIVLDSKSKKLIPEEQLLITKAIRETTTTTTTTTTECFKRRDGTSFPAVVTVAPIILEGKTIGAVEVFRDITKEMEIDKAKTEFVSLASHQLRTPLSTVNWYAEMLLGEDVGEINDKQKKYLDEIYTGNKRMVELVNTLLNVSRLELGTFMVELKPTDIVTLVHSVIKEQQPQITKRRIHLKTKFSKNIPQIQADPKLLRIVIQNLLSNAVKYTTGGGNVSMSIMRKDDHIAISVTDNGWGIPKNEQDQVFKKLFRATNVREQDAEGTGLGLYIVKLIIEHSGGTIRFESKEDKGTKFFVTFPLAGMKEKVGTKQLDE